MTDFTGEAQNRQPQVSQIGAIDVVSVAQERITDRVLAAELFVPNARDYGIDFLALFSLVSEWIAISNGGLASLAIWALTPKELHIFRAHQRPLGGVRISQTLHVWNLSEITARVVPSKGRHDPPAIRLRDAEDRIVEMRPIVDSDQAATIASALVTEPHHRSASDSVDSEPDSSSPAFRSVVTLGFLAVFTALMLTGDTSLALKLTTIVFALVHLVLTAMVLSARRLRRRQSLLLLTQAVISGVGLIMLSAWYFLEA